MASADSTTPTTEETFAPTAEILETAARVCDQVAAAYVLYREPGYADAAEECARRIRTLVEALS